ncbi:unnamed protein product [Adineta ricciae]|uniref:Uncharacterized protein n=1 Tax=Adineta ricciae TaxID=249248 RepID=A0A815KNU1_ADIRI|nr:unnamed protein product [Adineta ricciae]CAF1537066.1 unnamed protein product [Adineta ricciae]
MFRLYLLFHLLYLIYCVDIKNFVPFGIEHNDKSLENDLNYVTESISLSVRYSFFNKFYDELRISSHGLIMFGNETCSLSYKSSDPFPFQDLVCVAPFWINTNFTHETLKNIFYREILLKTEPQTLYQITKILRTGFPKLAAQRMLWAFVVTWYDLPDIKNEINRNTYQAILTTNGFYSFTLFTYHQLEWSQDSTGNHARIGFNAGDNVNYYQLKKSLSPQILSIVNDSNIGIPGQFIFHTTGHVNDIQCETSTGLQVSPFRGSIYGGYEFRLHGICFNRSTYEIRVDNHVVDDCRVLNSLYIVCTMPMLMDSGKIKIELFDNEENKLVDTTTFLAHVPEDHGELILKNYINLTHQIADPNNEELILEFQSNEITKKYLFKIVIYDYATQFSSNNQTLYNRTRQKIDLGLGYLNLSSIGNLTVRYDSLFSVNTDPNDRVHALQISFEMKHKPGWLRSALFVGAKIFTAATSLNAAYCPAWLLLQTDPRQYLEQVPVCACQMPTQPWPEEFHGFRIDEGCDARKPIEKTCTYHRKARGCYRKKSDTTWAGAQCCYDEHGKFIEQGNEGAGTLDVVSPDANSWLEKSLSMFGHFFSDFLSYWSCCRSLLISEEMCKEYYKYRPAGRCEDFESESIEKHGDPYFATLNGGVYAFRGQGEFTLLALPDFNGQEIQIRLSSNENDGNVGIEAFVIGFLHGKRRVQFELFSKYQSCEIRIDTKLIEVPHEEFAVAVLIYEDEFIKIKRKANGAFKISFPTTHFRLRVTIRPTFDFFDLETLVRREKFNKLSTPSYGLLGDVNGLTFPNGTRISIHESDEQTLFEYGQSWRVSRNSSLFHYSFDDMFDSTIKNELNSSEEMKSAEQNCHNGGTENEYCTKDMLSNEEDNLHHWESVKVVIDENVLLQTTSGSVSTGKCISSNFLLLLLLKNVFF